MGVFRFERREETCVGWECYPWWENEILGLKRGLKRKIAGQSVRLRAFSTTFDKVETDLAGRNDVAQFSMKTLVRSMLFQSQCKAAPLHVAALQFEESKE